MMGKSHLNAHCVENLFLENVLNIDVKGVHEESISYECEVCNHRFSQLGHLKKHVSAVHEKVKAHKCNICDCHFASMTHLMTHKQIFHDGKKPIQCKICNKSFSVKHNMCSQIKRNHGKKGIIQM